MTLIQDLTRINDVVNTLSLHATKSNEGLHREIYGLIAKHIRVEIPKSRGYLSSIFGDDEDDERDILTQQLVGLSSKLRNDRNVIDCFRRLNRVYDEQHGQPPDKDVLSCHMYIAMLNHVISHRVTVFQDKVILGKLYGYRGEDPRYFIPTREIISTNLSTILEARFDDQPTDPMIVKVSTGEFMERELEVYRSLRELNANIPTVYTEYKILGSPVLVMEKLYPLKISMKRIPSIAKAIIEQLKLVHVIGIHCDIKPSNIMQSMDGTIYLMDYGGMVMWDDEVMSRNTYTPAFASQRSTSKTPSITNDLIELIYTLNYFHNPRSYHHDLSDTYSSMLHVITTTPTSEVYDKLLDLLPRDP